MKCVGLLGGMSWESSALYYRLINEEVRARLGGFHSARCLLVSVDFADIERMQAAADWPAAGALLAGEAAKLADAGADFLVLCTNTMHKVAPVIEASVKIPLLHIADITAAAVTAAGIRTVGLLGTRFTMEEDFHRRRLEDHGLRVEVPDRDGRGIVDRVIFDELVRGEIRPESRASYLRIIDGLAARGCEGVILGCTEIELLIRPADVTLPTFATTALHARAAVDEALGTTG